MKTLIWCYFFFPFRYHYLWKILRSKRTQLSKASHVTNNCVLLMRPPPDHRNLSHSDGAAGITESHLRLLTTVCSPSSSCGLYRDLMTCSSIHWFPDSTIWAISSVFCYINVLLKPIVSSFLLFWCTDCRVLGFDK